MQHEIALQGAWPGPLSVAPGADRDLLLEGRRRRTRAVQLPAAPRAAGPEQPIDRRRTHREQLPSVLRRQAQAAMALEGRQERGPRGAE